MHAAAATAGCVYCVISRGMIDYKMINGTGRSGYYDLSNSIIQTIVVLIVL